MLSAQSLNISIIASDMFLTPTICVASDFTVFASAMGSMILDMPIRCASLTLFSACDICLMSPVSPILRKCSGRGDGLFLNEETILAAMARSIAGLL